MSADELLLLAARLQALHEADDLAGVLRAASQAVTELTGSPRGVAALPGPLEGELFAPGYHDTAHGWTSADLRWRRSHEVAGRVWDDGEPYVGTTRDEWAGGATLAAVAIISVPVRNDAGNVMGFVAVAGRAKAYGERDLERLGAVADHIGLRLRDLTLVQHFARLLGPGEAPPLAGAEIACLYAPSGAHVARFGGDFVDFFGGRNLQQVALAIGDVAGKGIEAAAVALTAKYAVRAALAGLRWPLMPGEALMAAGNALLDGNLPDHTFVTLEIGSLNVKDATFAFGSAGHPAPLIIREHEIERPLFLTAPAIGVTGEVELHPLPAESVDLAPGDAVLLFTDGMTEARNGHGEYYEDVRMVEALEELRGLPAPQLLQRLHDDVLRFTAGRPVDDIALVLLRLSRPLRADPRRRAE